MQPCDEGVILAGPAIAPCTAQARPWVLAATILGSSLAFIDGTVVNVALAALQADLNASAIDVQWVVEAYALLLASLLLVGGALGDLYGRKRIFMTGIIVFAAASTWCGLVPDIRQLIVARAVQGIGAALLVPGSLAIISASFSKQERGRAIGTWSGFTAITTAVGPVIGGWMIEQASWRWVFFINLPLALLVLFLTSRFVPESRNPKGAPGLDWWGTVWATIGLAGVTFALIESSNSAWNNPGVIIALVIGLSALAGFLIVESFSRFPLMPLNLFRSRDFAGANLLTLFLYGALSGGLFFFPLNLIQVQGYPASAAGAATLPFILLMFLLSRWSGGLVERYGARLPLAIGTTIAAIGFALFALPSIGGSYWTTFFPAVVVLGLGMATSVAPLTTTVMNAVGEQRAGIASGTNNAISRVAGVLAIAILGNVMLGVFDHQLSDHLSGVNLASGVRQNLSDQRIKLAATKVPEEVDVATRGTIEQSIRESFVSGFRLVMLIASGMALTGAASAFFMVGNKGRSALLVNKPPCSHLGDITSIRRPKRRECYECVKTGSRWVHLRTCQQCGVTLCCDNSPNRHASKHARATAHPVIASAEPGERWLYCYPDDASAEY